MTNGRTGFVSSWRGWAARLCLGCALAGLVFSLPIEGGQARRKSVHPAKAVAQQATAHRTPPPPVELCVVVRNVRGLAVADLRSSDFRLWDNNRLQRISDFAANIVPESVHHVKTPGSGRYIALYFDDLHYDFVQTIRVTDSAYSYFKSIQGFGNEVGVFTSSGEVTLNFTSNREKLHQALLAIKPHIATARQAKACPELTDFQAQMLLYGDDPLALKIALEDMNACSAPKGQVDPPISSLPVATLRRMKETIDARARQVIADSEIQSRKSLGRAGQVDQQDVHPARSAHHHRGLSGFHGRLRGQGDRSAVQAGNAAAHHHQRSRHDRAAAGSFPIRRPPTTPGSTKNGNLWWLRKTR